MPKTFLLAQAVLGGVAVVGFRGREGMGSITEYCLLLVGVVWLTFFILFAPFFSWFYLQLQEPACFTSSRTPIEQAACFMAHSLGYVVLSLAHTASSILLSGQVSSHCEQRPRLMRASHKHFFPALHWMSSHDLASAEKSGRSEHGRERRIISNTASHSYDWTKPGIKKRNPTLWDIKVLWQATKVMFQLVPLSLNDFLLTHF